MVVHMRTKRKTKTHGHGSASEIWHRSMTCQIWINIPFKWVTVADFMIPYNVQEHFTVWEYVQQSDLQFQVQAAEFMLIFGDTYIHFS